MAKPPATRSVPEIDWPARVHLARLPTPLEPLETWSRDVGYALWIKRDDLTGVALSGNKVRKLEYLIADAERSGADTLITCGGVNSNHARATAVAGARRGLGVHLVLRGNPPAVPNGNLLLDGWVGAHVDFITAAAWPEVQAWMERWADDLRGRGQKPYVIPEGGSNAVGVMGYVRAAIELVGQAQGAGIPLSRVVHATGSGGTTAGLALGLAAAGREDVECIGICVAPDAATFDRKITGLLDDVVDRGFASAGARSRARWRCIDGYVGAGYAETTPESLRALRTFARAEGVIVDPVYTGKALLALSDLEARDGITVFLHTGGLFELFAHADSISRLDEPRDHR